MTNLLEKIKENKIEYQEADEGIVTHTYITDDFVVQEPDHGGGGRLRKNRFICDYLYRNDAPVPEILEFSEDPLYLVFQRIEGISLDNREKFSDEDYIQAVRNSGKALAQIHKQEGFGYGEPMPEENFQASEYDNWREFTREYVEGTLNYVESDLFRPVVEKAEKVINLEKIPEKPDSRVLHMDYTPDNVIVGSDLDVNVIDFDGFLYGDPDFELMYAELIKSKRSDETASEFVEAYKKERDVKMSQEMEDIYTALSVMRDARGGEWCIKNDKDVDVEDWSQGLENTVNNL